MSDQEQVRQFVDEHDLGGDPSIWVHDVQSELGEVAKELLKATDYGEHAADDVTFDAGTAAEIGDLYFSLLGLANSLDVDLSDALDQVLAKYEDRLETTGDAGSGS